MKLTHVDGKGRPRMVDVSGKAETERTARACGEISLARETLELIASNAVPKGEVLNTARLAGIQAAKRAFEWIPLCHPLRLTHIDVAVVPVPDEGLVRVTATVKAVDRTGVEMEALTAVAAACLTVYDMCKAADKRMVVGGIRLVSKEGGKSGPFKW
ncbi:MAG TPA: cyclic pyranopterin monophosphate synthase MoaC [Acidobacteriota bacterium]|nr:cyclic pyranopterin monophosphate synthase MoaC [Acidobacteriota bacterium]